jgi:hypothetical protein
VGRDAALDGVAGQAPPGAGREQRILWQPGSFVEPDGEDCLGVFGERDRSLLAAFAFDADVRSGAEREVVAVDRDQLGDPQAGVERERERPPRS